MTTTTAQTALNSAPPTKATSLPSVDAAWNAVMADVLVITKDDVNREQNFKFRGVDAVVNAVGPALRAHGVTVLPKKILKVATVEYESKRGARMVNRQVTVRWQVRGPAGDSFTGESVGEAADSGDKSMSKAQSVAYRVFLLQSLSIPTGERDPDSDVHERASQSVREGEIDAALAAEVEAANVARGELLEATSGFGWDEEALVRRYWDDYRKNLRNTRDVAMIRGFCEALIAETKAKQQSQPEPETGPPQMANEALLKRLHTLLTNVVGITKRDDHLNWCSVAAGREIDSTKDLTKAEASRLIDKLEKLEPSQPKPDSPDETAS